MAVRLYVEVRARVAARGASSATDVDAREALRALQLDENGLGPVHHRILAVLRKHGRPVALPRLAARVGITAAAFRTIYEPALFGAGAIVSTPFGIGLG